MNQLILNGPLQASYTYFAVMISGWFAKVRFNSSSGSTSSPWASNNMKCNEGCVRPRSSFEIDETSHRHASDRATCESSCSARSSLSANPNASSVFKSRIIAGIDVLCYRNMFLVCWFVRPSPLGGKTHVDDFNPPAYSLV